MKRLGLLDTIDLRDTSCYKSPRDISPLQIICGDCTSVQIPCTQIDKDGRVHHASDRRMQLITKVYADGEPVDSGVKAYTAYQDETGQSIACVIFDEPQYEKKISISGKGSINLKTGALIESPADLIDFIFTDVQGYDPSSIDSGEIARFYADCLKEEITLAFVLNNPSLTIKSILDEIAANIHAHWLISDGKSVMRLRNASSAESPIYRFKEAEISEFSMTSEELINEVTVNYAYDLAQGKFTASITKHNPLSKLMYGNAKKVYDLRMVQGTRQAERLTDAILMTYSIPQIITAWKHSKRSIYVEVGDVCTITHRAGIGEHGFDGSRALVTSKTVSSDISYTATMEQDGTLYASELISLTKTAGAGKESISVSYENGVATITIYALVQGSPPVEGAEVIVQGTKKVTDKNGQARFNLDHGKYTAKIQASGYNDAEITFTV